MDHSKAFVLSLSRLAPFPPSLQPSSPLFFMFSTVSPLFSPPLQTPEPLFLPHHVLTSFQSPPSWISTVHSQSDPYEHLTFSFSRPRCLRPLRPIPAYHPDFNQNKLPAIPLNHFLALICAFPSPFSYPSCHPSVIPVFFFLPFGPPYPIFRILSIAVARSFPSPPSPVTSFPFFPP